MSAIAYAEPYAHDRRHVRHQLRHSQSNPHKSTNIVQLVPRQFKQDKTLELSYSLGQAKYRGISALLAGAAVVGLHVLAFAYFYAKPEAAPVTKVQTPPIKIERYVPPEIPPQVIQPEPPKPQPKEPPKPVKPKPVKPPERVNPNVVHEVVPPPAPVAEAPAAPVKTGPSADANYLHNPAPVYPEFAQEQGWEGSVILSVVVLPNGKPKTVEVKQSSGRKILDEAAIQTVKRWSFVPAKLGDEAVEASVEVPIDFRLAT